MPITEGPSCAHERQSWRRTGLLQWLERRGAVPKLPAELVGFVALVWKVEGPLMATWWLFWLV